jgi:hypothetical protein
MFSTGQRNQQVAEFGGILAFLTSSKITSDPVRTEKMGRNGKGEQAPSVSLDCLVPNLEQTKSECFIWRR